jgi:ATP-dependent RNA helicase RhlE
LSFNQFPLDARLQSNIERAGWTTPTPIQTQAIPIVLDGHDLIGTAQTGTGKTAAFVLPMMNRLLLGKRTHGVRALIVTPTRELAEQIHQAIRMLSAGTPLRSATVYGGVSAGPQIRALRAGVDIVVACPGRLLDHVGSGFARLDSVGMLVLDEADRMFDMGFMPAVREIISHLPAQRQTVMFSATFPPEIEKLTGTALTKPRRVSIDLERPAHTVSHMLYPVPSQHKTALVFDLLDKEKTDSVLIFTRTKHRAERLAKQLIAAGRAVTHLHANRTQGQRQAALDGFRGGQYRIMVATDIAARGIDVDTISHVINYDMPDTADAYIHRIGRTGRALRSGQAWTFITHEDSGMVRTLEKIMGERIPRASVGQLAEVAAQVPAPSYDDHRPARDSRSQRPQAQKSSHARPHRDERPAAPRPHRDERPAAARPHRDVPCASAS